MRHLRQPPGVVAVDRVGHVEEVLEAAFADRIADLRRRIVAVFPRIDHDVAAELFGEVRHRLAAARHRARHRVEEFILIDDRGDAAVVEDLLDRAEVFEHQFGEVLRPAFRADRESALDDLIQPDVEVAGPDDVGGLADQILDDLLRLGIREAVERTPQRLDLALGELVPVAVIGDPLRVADDLQLRHQRDVVALRRRLDLLDVLAAEGLLAPGEGGTGHREVVGEFAQDRVVFEFGEHLDHPAETVGLGRGDLREFEEERAHFEVGPVGDAARLERLAAAVAEHPLERLHAVEKPAHVARPDDDPVGRNREGVALDRLRHPVLREFEAAERLAVLRRDDFAALHRLLVDVGERLEIEVRRRGDGEFGGERETPFRRFEFLRLRDDQRIAVAGPPDRGHIGEERDGERQRQQHQHSFQHGE